MTVVRNLPKSLRFHSDFQYWVTFDVENRDFGVGSHPILESVRNQVRVWQVSYTERHTERKSTDSGVSMLPIVGKSKVGLGQCDRVSV